jgi:predicted DNA-binding protein
LPAIKQGDIKMATQNPRIQVMLDAETNGLLASLAERQERSISMTAAELIREALELHEDFLLSQHGDQRIASTQKWINHEDAWK